MGEQLELDGGFASNLEAMCSLGNARLVSPIRFDADDRAWLGACDGTMLVALVESEARTGLLRESGIVPLHPDGAMLETLQGFVTEESPEVGINTMDVTVEKLRAWAGSPNWHPDCESCGGEGKVEAKADCWACEGSGEVSCECDSCGNDHERECSSCGGDGDGEVKPGEMEDCVSCVGSGKAPRSLLSSSDGHKSGGILGLCIDRRRLARLLSFVDGDCRAWCTDDDRLSMNGDGWHLTLMMLNSMPPETMFAP